MEKLLVNLTLNLQNTSFIKGENHNEKIILR